MAEKTVYPGEKKAALPRFFSRRGEVLAPAAVIGFTMMGTVLLSTLFSLWAIRLLAGITAGLGAAALLLSILRRKGLGLPRADFFALFFLSAAAALLLAGGHRASLLEAREMFAGKEAEISGTVSSVVRREDGGSSFLIENGWVRAADGAEGKADVLFYTDGELSFDGGEKVTLAAELSEELTLSQVGMGAELTAFRAEYIRQDGAAFWHPLYRLRSRFLNWAQARVYAAMPRESGNVMLGMLLGSREQLGSDVYALLQGSGLVHILSVSGLHIAVFFSLAQKIFRRAGRRAANFLSIPLAGAYVFLTGASVPSVRSFAMIAFLAVAEALYKPKNTTASLGLAVTFFCIADPMCVLQMGTVLSVVAVWCLYAVAPAIKLPGGKSAGVLQGGAVSAAVSAVTLPVMALLSGYLPLLSPFCSVLALPVMPAALGLGVLCALFGGSAIGKICGAAGNLLVEWIFFVSRLGDAGPKIPLGNRMVALGCGAVAVFFLLAAAFVGIRKISRYRGMFVSLTAVLLAVTGVCSALRPDAGLKLVSLEGAYILQQGGQALVIGSGKSDFAGQTAAQYLRASGVTDYALLIPEGKMGFTGGSYELLTQFPAETLIAAGNDSRLAAAIASTGAGEVIPADGWSKWAVPGGEMEIRPGGEGPYLLFTTGEGERFVLQDQDDPEIYGGGFTLCYDEGADGLRAALPEPERAGGPARKLSAGDEMPRWGAGFTRPDWTVYLESPVRVQAEGGWEDADE